MVTAGGTGAAAAVVAGGTGAFVVITGSTGVTGAAVVNPAGGAAVVINTGGAVVIGALFADGSHGNDSEFAVILTKHRSHAPGLQIRRCTATLYPMINVIPSHALAPSQAMDPTFNTVFVC